HRRHRGRGRGDGGGLSASAAGTAAAGSDLPRQAARHRLWRRADGDRRPAFPGPAAAARRTARAGGHRERARAGGAGAGGTAPLLLPLLSFNLGVELGQLAVAALLWALLVRLRRHLAFARVAVPATSLLVAGAGLYWLLARVAG